jgi:hypothetical protein
MPFEVLSTAYVTDPKSNTAVSQIVEVILILPEFLNQSL